MLRFFSLVCLVLVFATGCGTGYESAQGIVTLEGTPIEGAVVSFSPKEGSTGAPGVGTTNKLGKFTIAPMISGGPTSGAKVGEYLVSVSKAVTADLSVWNVPTDAASTKPPRAVEIKHEIPAAYSVPNTSGLSASVKAGVNNFEFDLQKNFGSKNPTR